MKRLLFIALSSISLFFLSSCAPIVPVDDSIETVSNTTITTVPETTKPLPFYVPGSIKLDPNEDYCTDGESYYKRSFRLAYYRIPFNTYNLFEDQSNDFLNSVAMKDDGNEPKEMTVVSFVKHFEISKEQFIELIEGLKTAWISGNNDLTLEENELPNADIIYTFDNEIINNYYRRE